MGIEFQKNPMEIRWGKLAMADNKSPLDRGAKDDWEALKIVLDERPALRQRVMHRLRALMSMSSSKKAKAFNDKKPKE